MAGKKSRKKPVHLKTPFSAHKLPPAPPPACSREPVSCSLPSEELAHNASSPHSIINSSVNMCRHLEKGVNIEKLSSQLSKANFSIIHCQDCTKDSKSGTGKKGKGRSNRKKAGAVTEQMAPHLQEKWVCLACGHIGCVSLLTHTNKKSEQQESVVDIDEDKEKRGARTGHAWKHSRCANHPLSLRVADNVICWCFTCNMAIDCSNSASPQLASGSSPLQAAVKMLHEKLQKERSFLKDPGKRDDVGELVRCSVDDACQSNSVLVLPQSSPVSMNMTGIRRKRTVKGLMNLGNTCFFNSVMQNLLALDTLRDYFSQELPDGAGPLTSSLRKLYLETNLDGGGQFSTASDALGYESGLKKGGKGRALWEMNGGACNPRSLFGAICAKAPRFRGFQQQDSHELLRCLLDGLNSEERSARAKSTGNGHFIKRTSASVANRVLIPNGDCSNPELMGGEREHKSPEDTGPPLVAATTAVESFFGGQLCSRVRCCECGHSSVVYETMLDLSLQIPTQRILKKGQRSANQWKPSSFGGGSQQREVTHVKVPPKASVGKAPNAVAVVETGRSSLQGSISAQGSEMHTSAAAEPSSPKLALTDSSLLDDLWMDFIDSGLKCAESSIQGSADVPNSVETCENNLVVDIEDCVAGSTLKTASHSSIIADMNCQNEHKTETSTGVRNDKLCDARVDADTPTITEDKEVLKPLAPCEEEDGPLPIASGVLLLPYEPLELSSILRGEESSASVGSVGNDKEVLKPLAPCEEEDGSLPKASGVLLLSYEPLESSSILRGEESLTSIGSVGNDKKVLKPLAPCEEEDGPLPMASGILLLSYEPLESSSILRGEESSASIGSVGKDNLMDVSSLTLESDGDFDGFSQLFEEEESCFAVTQSVKPSGGNLEDQVVDSAWDDGRWEARTAVYDGNEVATRPQKLSYYEDAIFPMSLEGCLADFTKPELLCGENAWECESCTRRLKNKKRIGEDTNHSATTEDICGSGDLEKGLAELQVEKEMVCFTVPAAGNCPWQDSGKSHTASCTQNGNTDQVSEGCESLLGRFNESMSCSSAVLDQNGSTHSTKSGELFESQSSPCQVDITSNIMVKIQHMNNITADMPISEQSNEIRALANADNANLQSVNTDSLVGEKAQEACGNLEHAHFLALPDSSKEKPINAASKPIKEFKCKAKTKKLHIEKLVKKDATKKLSISKAPVILTVHLKRFAQDMRGRLSKLNGHVSFPELLDLRPFLDPRCLDSDSCYYQLVGVVEHGGTMRGGHYTAYVRSPGVEESSDSMEHRITDFWYYVSDSSVRKASLQAVLNSEAYLLFYEKCEAKKSD